MPLSAESVSSLLGLLYEASASPERWPGFLSALKVSAQADAAYFVLVDPHGGCDLSLQSGFDPVWKRAYTEHFHQHDIVLRGFLAAKRVHGQWVGTRNSVIPEANYFGSTIFNEFVKPQGKLHRLRRRAGRVGRWTGRRACHATAPAERAFRPEFGGAADNVGPAPEARAQYTSLVERVAQPE